MMTVTIIHRGVRRTVDEAEWQATVDDMVKTLGPWNPATSSVTFNPDTTAQPEPETWQAQVRRGETVTLSVPEPAGSRR